MSTVENLSGDAAQNSVTTHFQHDCLSIIGDMRKDLDSMEEDVSMCKQQLCKPDGQHIVSVGPAALEQVLLHLTTENERLQEELHRAKEQNNHKYCELEENNLALSCEINRYQESLCKKEREITELKLQMTKNGCAECSAEQHKHHELAETKNRELEEELEKFKTNERRLVNKIEQLQHIISNLKTKNDKSNAYVSQLSALLKKQEELRMQQENEFTKFKKQYDEDCQQVKLLKKNMDILTERQKQAEKTISGQNKMNKKLGENLAEVLGRNKSLAQQLKYAQHETLLSKEYFIKSQNTQRELQQLLDAKSEELQGMAMELHRLKNITKQQQEICMQQKKVVDSFQQWQQSQLLVDEEIKYRFEQYESHIKLLVEYVKKLLGRIKVLLIDYNILRNEVECAGAGAGNNFSNNSLTQRMDLLQRTTKRIMQLTEYSNDKQ